MEQLDAHMHAVVNGMAAAELAAIATGAGETVLGYSERRGFLEASSGRGMASPRPRPQLASFEGAEKRETC